MPVDDGHANEPRLPETWEEVEALVQERNEELDGIVQILHALDHPVIRIAPDNSIQFLNNVFLEFAEVKELDDANIRRESIQCRGIYEGSDFLVCIDESQHERFEQMKKVAVEKYHSDRYLFRIGEADEFTFRTYRGGEIPIRLVMTFSNKYQAYQLGITDITDLKNAEQELRTAHAELEQRVEERTLELRQTHDAMMEMSTPVIRLWEGILLLPMIGAMDTRRAAQMSDTLLQAIAQNEAKVAILDITGMPTIDTSSARHILVAVDACRILGAEVLLTGISPEIAQTLTQLGVDFSALRTRGSLQMAIVEALRMVGTGIRS